MSRLGAISHFCRAEKAARPSGKHFTPPSSTSAAGRSRKGVPRSPRVYVKDFPSVKSKTAPATVPAYTKSYFDVSSQPNGMLSLSRSLELSSLSSVGVVNFAPGQGYTFTHSHAFQEEVYICVQGHGQIQLNDDVLSMAPGDVVRVSPETRRSLHASPIPRTTGYSRTHRPSSSHTNFVVYVIGNGSHAFDHGLSTSDVMDDGRPHFDDVPQWFEGDDRVVERNQLLMEKYQRMSRDTDKEQRNSSRRCFEKKMFLASESEQDDKAAEPTPAQSLSTVSARVVLADADGDRVFMLRDQGGSGALDLPGGGVEAGESPEDVLVRSLEACGISSDPATMRPLTFCCNKNGSGLTLVFTCSSWKMVSSQVSSDASWLPLSHVDAGSGGTACSPVVLDAMPSIETHVHSLATP
mmetsp:Transcript_95/g.134  ORF Transcript_95/g.134 Transcript_95/m.134 type:complete len:409 (+) Transcript_95:275-1501(+)